MPYTVTIKRSAEREMAALPDNVFERVTISIIDLESNPRKPGCKKLRGSHHYRVRSGDYRILYTIDDENLVVEIVAVGHRKDVYRGR